MNSEYLLEELLLISLGKQDSFSTTVSENDWGGLLDEAQKQSILGPLTRGIERLPTERRPPKLCLLQWIGNIQLIEDSNKLQQEQVKLFASFFREAGFRTCLLKGQGAALLYPAPLLRQCGDIDLWVDGDRKKIVEFCGQNWEIDHVDIKNLVLKNIPDVVIEVHFIPSWFYSPFRNNKFKHWYREQWDAQFTNETDEGFCVPTIEFNLVYSLVHIFRHQFEEGIGLRQLMDYYYILTNSSQEERQAAITSVRKMRMMPFCGAVMYVMEKLFHIEKEFLLCERNNRLGRKMVDSILRGGNFGHYDKRNAHGVESRMERGFRNLRHNVHLLLDYPAEVLWSPLWKCWHWVWRKRKGYL